MTDQRPDEPRGCDLSPAEIARQVDERRADKDFQERLDKIIDEDREVLERLGR